jgi:2'-5' RNA ligase
MSRLKNLLEDNLVKNDVRWRRESRAYQGHLTLARFIMPMRNDALPPLNRSLNWQYPANAFYLMKSDLYRGGAVYEKLGKFDFGGNLK